MMNTVGADKRTQYYRMGPDTVLKTLKSHTLGLTNSEAARRQADQGANVLPNSRLSEASLLLQAAGHPYVAVTALAAALASFASQTNLALLLAGLLGMHVALRFSALRSQLSGAVRVTLPTHVKVTRNDQTRSLETANLVVGDIVHVAAGETVPADLRILEENDLVTNDSLLFGGNLQTRKFSHAVSQVVPLLARNNQLWAGSTVVQGSGRGVVIAIGAQTELGRIAVLHRTALLHKLVRYGQDPARYVFSALALLAGLALLLLGWQSGSDSNDVLLALLLVAVSIAPNGLGLTRWLLAAQASRRVSDGRNASLQGSTLAAFGGADIAIIDTADAAHNTVVARTVTVGRTTYTTEDTGYEPTGKIIGDNGKALTRKQAADLKLLFEACALVNNAAVLRPDTRHKAWHARGNLYEVAALVLARKGGINTERLQAGHEVLRAFPYDAGRQLASSVRKYGSDTVVFVRGNPAAVLEHSNKLWDHGHVRALSVGDKTFFAEQTPAIKGKAYMAFAYRILPDKTDLSALDMDAAEQDLTFLGIVEMEHVSAMDAVVTAAQAAGLRTVTVTADAHPGSISSASLRKLNDAQLVMLFEENCLFSRLTTEDMLRLVTTAQYAGHRVAMMSNGLASMPARVQAEAGMTLGQHYQRDNISEAAEFTAALAAARDLLLKLDGMQRLAVIQSVSLAVAGLLSAVGLFYYRVPFAASVGVVLALQLLVFPFAAFALPLAKGHLVATRELAAAGCTLGLLAYLGFIYSFNVRGVSPSFIGPSNRFTLAAVTASAMILGLAMFAEVLLVHYQTRTTPNMQRWVYLGAAAFVMINIAYNPWLQGFLGITALTLPDWLAVIGTALLYAGFRLFQHHTRHHTREAVVRLHREVHGPHAPLTH